MEYDIIKLFLKEKVDPLPDCFVAVLLAMTRAIKMIPAPTGDRGDYFFIWTMMDSMMLIAFSLVR